MDNSPFAVEIITDKTILDIITERTDDPDQEEAFFVADLSQIIYRFKFWQAKMDGIRLLFPLRYNNDPKVIITLSALGVNFSCASKTEIENVLRAGIDPSRICYSNQCKSPMSLSFAAECGVKWLFFDNKCELQKIKDIHPSAELILPIDISYSPGPKNAIKSGYVHLDEVSSLLQEARDLQLQVVGVSFYIENIEEVEEFTNAILTASRVFRIGESLGFHFSILDLGTGFPSKTETLEVNFNQISSIVKDVLHHHFHPSNEVQIVANPGRFLVSSSFVLCANIIAKREMETATENGEKTKVCHYYINDGVFGSFSDVIYYKTTYHPIAIKRNQSNTVHRSVVWGPTCDSTDRIVECSLPNLSVGDWLMFRDMGAYSFTRNTSFNGFNTPKVKYILPAQATKYLQNLPNWSEIWRRLNISS
ncbi:ornithine decarboxylase-like [Centruroides vittatus]|uniref:ornithine decarboxylase-like n=1 Tax=Centruroides vittatus TaxID=120091 RepID=UPI00350F6BD9